jgi:hypothetical protein
LLAQVQDAKKIASMTSEAYREWARGNVYHHNDLIQMNDSDVEEFPDSFDSNFFNNVYIQKDAQ